MHEGAPYVLNEGNPVGEFLESNSASADGSCAADLPWHPGESGEGEEWPLLLKTTGERNPALEEHLLERHPWDNPESRSTGDAGAARAELLD